MSDMGFGLGRHEGRFEAPERYEGFVVYDPLGQKIGSVERLFVDGDGEPVYVRVRMGVRVQVSPAPGWENQDRRGEEDPLAAVGKLAGLFSEAANTFCPRHRQ